MREKKPRPVFNIRLATPSEGSTFGHYLQSVAMNIPEGMISKKTKIESDLLSSLAFIRQARVDGYVFDGSEAGLIGIATATLYPKQRLEQLGLSCDGDDAYYLAELRLDPKADRMARVQWKRSLRELIERTVQPIFTAVFDGNADALRSFTSGREEITYRKLYSYSVFIIRAVKAGSAPEVSDIAGHWVLESENKAPEVFSLNPCSVSDLESSLVPSVTLVSGVLPVLSIGLEESAAQTLRENLKNRGISFLEVPSTLYEATLSSRPARIEITRTPSQIPLEML